jgi:hypothetical protein
MRIAEIISGTSDKTLERSTPLSVPHPLGHPDLMQGIANAFTRDGTLKHFWDVDPFDQPPDAEPSARTASLMPDAAMSAVHLGAPEHLFLTRARHRCWAPAPNLQLQQND